MRSLTGWISYHEIESAVVRTIVNDVVSQWANKKEDGGCDGSDNDHKSSIVFHIIIDLLFAVSSTVLS